MYPAQLSVAFEALETTSPDTINILPTEILIEIFEKLHQGSLASVSRVCRRWNAIALPALYHTMDVGDYCSLDFTEQQALLDTLTAVTFQNPKLCALVRHFNLEIPNCVAPIENIKPPNFSCLETISILSMNQIDSFARLMCSWSVRTLKKLHIGFRHGEAETVLQKLFLDSLLAHGPMVLEELRCSWLRTKREDAEMGGFRDDKTVMEDYVYAAAHGTTSKLGYHHLFPENYIYYLSSIASLKTLDFDLGVNPDSFVDPRRSLAESYSAISVFLRGPNPTPPTRHNEKILLLNPLRLEELARDVSDETIRRSAISEASDVDKLVLSHLPLVPHYNSIRNSARVRLSTLSPSSFRRLVMDILFGLQRAFPRLRNLAAYKHLFPPPEPFKSRLVGPWRMSGSSLAKKIKLLQVSRGLQRNQHLVAHLRDAQAYVVPLIYERLEEAGLRNVHMVRVRLFNDGLWIEVRIQRAGEVGGEVERVEVVSFFPDVVLMEGESARNEDRRWGVYALYRQNSRVRVDVGLLGLVEGKWRLVGS